MKKTLISALLVLLLVSYSQGKLVGNAYPFTVPDATYSVTTYGAKGDGKTDDTKAIQATFDAAKGGGTVQFPSGTYLTYPFSFSGSNTVMDVASGATILAQPNKGSWPGGSSPKPFISITNFNDVSITGSGKIDGQGSNWWPNPKDGRPNIMQTNGVSRLYIKGVTFQNSANHNLELYANNAELDGVTISAPGDSPNTDGVDLHGTPFYIHDCDISVGDDNVAIHVSNVLIENCNFGTGHGISIGSIASGTYTNITARGIKINGAQAGPRIKTDPGATGSISKVTYENITLTNVKTGLIIDMFYDDGPTQPTTMKISDITFSGITGSASAAGSLKCQPSSPCEGITLKDITITGSSGWSCENIKGSQSSVSPSSCISTMASSMDAPF